MRLKISLLPASVTAIYVPSEHKKCTTAEQPPPRTSLLTNFKTLRRRGHPVKRPPHPVKVSAKSA
jgi:hypothetical protein